MPLIVCAPTHDTLPLMEKYVKQYDIKIAIHNHGPEDKHFPTPQSVLEAVRNMDPRCGLCIDVGHTARTGVDVVESVRGWPDRACWTCTLRIWRTSAPRRVRFR